MHAWKLNDGEIIFWRRKQSISLSGGENLFLPPRNIDCLGETIIPKLVLDAKEVCAQWKDLGKIINP